MTPPNKLPRRTPLLHPSLVYQSERRKNGAETVTYRSYGQGLRAHYERVLKAGGWIKMGTFSNDEVTDCGGDWGGHFQKGPLRMKFHLCGPEDQSSWNYGRGRMKKQQIQRMLWITTYDFHPRQLLGRDYQQTDKATSP
jgi:hypothetical protein